MAVMLREAIEAKERELGRKYPYRELAEDAAVDYSHIAKIVRRQRKPTPDVLRALSTALHPYFPLDQALVAAGYMPASPALARLIEQLVHGPIERVRELERTLAEHAGSYLSEVVDEPAGESSRAKHEPSTQERDTSAQA